MKILIGLVVLSFAIRIGASFVSAEISVANSKKSPWPIALRSDLISACSQANSTRRYPEFHPRIMSYCSCIIGAIERQQILPTQFNRVRTSQNKAIISIASSMSEFLLSAEGQGHINGCMARAIAAYPDEVVHLEERKALKAPVHKKTPPRRSPSGAPKKSQTPKTHGN